jgi:hypothetical protein
LHAEILKYYPKIEKNIVLSKIGETKKVINGDYYYKISDNIIYDFFIVSGTFAKYNDIKKNKNYFLNLNIPNGCHFGYQYSKPIIVLLSAQIITPKILPEYNYKVDHEIKWQNCQ